jgi:hypothetical protein
MKAIFKALVWLINAFEIPLFLVFTGFSILFGVMLWLFLTVSMFIIKLLI